MSITRCLRDPAYIIENLLAAIFDIKHPTSYEHIRDLHFQTLQIHNPTFFSKFYERQQTNAPTTSILHQQLWPAQDVVWFSKQRLAQILALKRELCEIATLPIQTGGVQKLVEAFQNVSNDKSYVANLCVTLQRLLQDDVGKYVYGIIDLLFEAPVSADKTSLLLNELVIRMLPREMLFMSSINLSLKQVSALQNSLVKQ